MKQYCYCRVSSLDQSTTIQKEILSKAYPDAVILEEKASGTDRNGRPTLELLMTIIGKGDTLIVWKLDRLARNMRDLMNLVHELEQGGASLLVHDQRIDTSTAAGKAFLQMLGVFAEFETNLRKERQMAGIAKAKEKGVYKGGKPTAMEKADQVLAMLKDGHKKAAIARELEISRMSVHRIVVAHEEKTEHEC